MKKFRDIHIHTHTHRERGGNDKLSNLKTEVQTTGIKIDNEELNNFQEQPD
jgi:hypothetical protein